MALVLCLCLVCADCGNDEPALFEQYFVMDEGLPADYKTGDVAFQQGMQAFKSERYQLATQFFRQTNSLSVGFDTLSYFLGLSEVGLNRHVKAMAFIDVVFEISDSKLKEKADWTRALLRFKTGAHQEAQDILMRIADTEGHLFQQEAKDVMQSLN